MRKGEILDKAGELLAEDREADYGDARKNHERIAALWSAYLGHEVRADQVAVCMALLKISRLAHQPGHEDSAVDAAAYLAIAGECAGWLDAGGPVTLGPYATFLGALMGPWASLNDVPASIERVYDRDGDPWDRTADGLWSNCGGAHPWTPGEMVRTDDFGPYVLEDGKAV